MINLPLVTSNYYGVFHKQQGKKYKWLCVLKHESVVERKLCISEEEAAGYYNFLIDKYKLNLPRNVLKGDNHSFLYKISKPKPKPKARVKKVKPPKPLFRKNSVEASLNELGWSIETLQDYLLSHSIPDTALYLKRSIVTLKSFISKNNLKTLVFNKICPVCKQIFETILPFKVFCSHRCNHSNSKRKYYSRNAKKLYIKNKKLCVKCNINVPEKYSRICNPCKSKLKEKKTCKTCSQVLTSNRKTYCSPRCQPKQVRVTPVMVKECIICQKTFSAKGSRKTCSPDCSKINTSLLFNKWRSNPANKERMRLANRLYGRKQRKGKTYKYTINREIANIRRSLKSKNHKRNNIEEVKVRLSLFGEGICCFCNVHTVAGETRTIEHLNPVVSGGNNESFNLYTSCRKCNESKGTREWKAWYQEQSFYNQSREHEISILHNPDWKNLIP